MRSGKVVRERKRGGGRGGGVEKARWEREEKVLKMEAGGIKEKKERERELEKAEKWEWGRLPLTFPLKDPPEIAKDGGSHGRGKPGVAGQGGGGGSSTFVTYVWLCNM